METQFDKMTVINIVFFRLNIFDQSYSHVRVYMCVGMRIYTHRKINKELKI